MQNTEPPADGMNYLKKIGHCVLKTLERALIIVAAACAPVAVFSYLDAQKTNRISQSLDFVDRFNPILELGDVKIRFGTEFDLIDVPVKNPGDFTVDIKLHTVMVVGCINESVVFDRETSYFVPVMANGETHLLYEFPKPGSVDDGIYMLVVEFATRSPYGEALASSLEFKLPNHHSTSRNSPHDVVGRALEKLNAPERSNRPDFGSEKVGMPRQDYRVSVAVEVQDGIPVLHATNRCPLVQKDA